MFFFIGALSYGSLPWCMRTGETDRLGNVRNTAWVEDWWPYQKVGLSCMSNWATLHILEGTRHVYAIIIMNCVGCEWYRPISQVPKSVRQKCAYICTFLSLHNPLWAMGAVHYRICATGAHSPPISHYDVHYWPIGPWRHCLHLISYRDYKSGRHILWHCPSSLRCCWHATNSDRD